jgi:DNA-3-methyladenine glycosylase I
VRAGPVKGEDGKLRCPWAISTPDYIAYHDAEWGKPLATDDQMFERMSLEGFQSGLSWLIILRKRPGFRAAFANFSIPKVAAYDERDVERLLGDTGIVRNRQKIEATIDNATAVQSLPGGLLSFVTSFAPAKPPKPPKALADVRATSEESVAMAKALKKHGVRFVGPTTAYALMQATGLVNDHLARCYVR